MSIEEIIENITSRDSFKVWQAACAIIELGQDPEKIAPIIAHLPEIKEKTKGLDMGGAFAPNQRFVDFAIRTLEFHRDSKACSCTLYEENGLDPQKEQGKGHIHISEIQQIEGGWVDYYIADCLKCGSQFKIIERNSHYTWWQWTKMPKA